jgi:hypothetical protein
MIQKARLAASGLASDHDDAAASRLSPLHKITERLQLGISS